MHSHILCIGVIEAGIYMIFIVQKGLLLELSYLVSHIAVILRIGDMCTGWPHSYAFMIIRGEHCRLRPRL